MTTLLDDVMAPVEPPSRRHRWLMALGLVVLLAVIGAGAGAVVYAHTYSPLVADGGASGVSSHSMKVETDGSQWFQWVLVGPTGTTGTAYYTVRNSGRHSATLLGPAGADPALHLSLKWSAVTPTTGAVGGTGQARSLPVTIGRGESVIIQMTVTQPTCAGFHNRTLDGTSIRWTALGVHHVFDVPTEFGGFVMPIDTCPSQNVLRLTKF